MLTTAGWSKALISSVSGMPATRWNCPALQRAGCRRDHLPISLPVTRADATIKTVERIAREVFIPLTVGGGVRSVADIRNLLNAGEQGQYQYCGNRPGAGALGGPAIWRPGIVVAMDVKRVSSADEDPRYELFTHGGRHPTGLEAVPGQSKWPSSARRNFADQYGPGWHPGWL